MDNKTKYLIYNLLDWMLSVGGSTAIILINYLSADNSLGFKLGLGGIVLFVVGVFVCKGVYEKSYQKNMNNYLNLLASENDIEVKEEIKKKIAKLEQTNNIYSRLLVVLPFVIVYLVCSLGAESLASLKASTGFIIIALGGGSIFNVIKQPLKKEVAKNKICKKIESKKQEN